MSQYKQVLDYLQALAAGASDDRGLQRAASAKGKVRSLRFLAYKVGLSSFRELLHNPLVEAWLSAEKWNQNPAKEALPLPLFVVAQLEKALQSLEDGAADGWFLGCILLMTWGSLRWSDAQRLQLNTLACDGKSLRGWSWRSKTAVTGIPFRVSLCGATQGFWGPRGCLNLQAHSHPGIFWLPKLGVQSHMRAGCPNFVVALCSIPRLVKLRPSATAYTFL